MLLTGGIVTAELNIARPSNIVSMRERMMIEMCVRNGIYTSLNLSEDQMRR